MTYNFKGANRENRENRETERESAGVQSFNWLERLKLRGCCGRFHHTKANGPDGISAKMLKCTAVSNAPSITEMFNLCIKMGKIPEGWKLLFIVPIPKSSTNQHLTSNYRPISLLCVLSKVLEQHIHSHYQVPGKELSTL